MVLRLLFCYCVSTTVLILPSNNAFIYGAVIQATATKALFIDAWTAVARETGLPSSRKVTTECLHAQAHAPIICMTI